MIFYFSGTGNTQWAAEELAKKTGERLLFIPEELKGECIYELHDGERLGFCFPVHGWQPPHIVRDFIRKASFDVKDDTFIFALATCGDNIGRTMELLNQDLGKKGLKASSVYSLIMPETYVCLPFMYTDTPEKEREKIMQAKRDIYIIGEEILNRREGITRTTRGAIPWTYTHVIGAYFNAQMITDEKFSVDADACIHCGKCQKVCPTNNVLLKNGLPTWQHDYCTCCMACYHYCPKHAINYGSITRKRGQYFFGHKENQ
jgi:Pyruvate/2-oxoacid:ferredoxin oxidoreductase delta subunit/flavodoxin